MVHAHTRAHVDTVDLSHLAGAAQEEAVEQDIGEALGHVFALSTLPLVKWRLYSLHDDDHILLQVEHHLVHDGWEIAVGLRELQELYTAAVEGRPAALEELPIQYADYALWQRSEKTWFFCRIWR